MNDTKIAAGYCQSVFSDNYMNILHYTLGLAPYRSGGLTRYATDLMLTQKADGDTVSLLYPGDYTFWRSTKIRIEKEEDFNGIFVYEIKNSSPVPLLHGIRKPSFIFEKKQKISNHKLARFYNDVKPDILHIHTLMGISPELIVYLKEKGAKVVFTSHDYYGLCPKVNFINRDGLFCDSPGGENCALCNSDAPSLLFLRLRNSKYILKFKEMFSLDIIKSSLALTKNTSSNPPCPKQKLCEEYEYLLSYYKKLFALVDCFHFNSLVSKGVYERYFMPQQSVVLPITHSGIKDARKLKKFDKKHIRLAFIGGTSAYKGFPMLKEALRKLRQHGYLNWSLQVWGGQIGIDEECVNIIYKGKYSSDDLANVFSGIDLLIVPSIWKETFSLITLEALSFGVPVLVSNNVGAKDIVEKYNPAFVVYPADEVLSSKLMDIMANSMLLEDYNKAICENPFEYLFEDHLKKIKQLYIDVRTEN